VFGVTTFIAYDEACTDEDHSLSTVQMNGMFLSVVSEYFFKQPELLAEKHPELYGMLERMFRVPDELPKNQ
jgi:hypothetical protein